MHDFADHLMQLALHAGHSLGDVLPSSPIDKHKAVREMTHAARSFYRSTQEFAIAVRKDEIIT